MKRLLTILLTGLFTTQAQALNTKECPESFEISYERLSALSDEKLLEFFKEDFSDQAGWEWGWNRTDEEGYQLPQYRDFVRAARADEYQNLQMELYKRANGICYYRLEGTAHEGDGDFETRLMTKKGRTVLRVSILDETRPVWTYHNVTTLNPEEIELEPKEYSVLLGYFEDFSAWYKVGFAKNPTIQILK